ncbi:MAG: hypothetical protein KJ710_05490 [Candidatus Omnitrophica bacterium]|nr:hypothetical protein [Candidatus Omnitrophota bacterium]MBU1923689.1 hypothetical protein [Candidatus Omnitrophota bacterium]
MVRLSRNIFLVLSVLVLFASFALAEEITITTYYPSPYGSYNELQLYPHSTPTATCDAAHKGTMYYDSDDSQIKVCDGAGTWSSLSGFWAASGNNIYNTNSGNVGIGTMNATSKLQIGTNPEDIWGDFVVSNANGGISVGVGASNAWINSIKNMSISGAMTIENGGNVGIGTSSPSGKLDVAGTIYATLGTVGGAANMRYNNGTRQVGWNDLAELFDTSEDVEPGDVLSIAADKKLKKSNKAYDFSVVGIVSEAPAILFEGSQLQILPQSYKFTIGRKPPIALAGRTLCKVTTNIGGSIGIGDLLVTSSKPGYAMKGDPEKIQIGTVLGKAMEPLEKGEGKIVVLVTLQ